MTDGDAARDGPGGALGAAELPARGPFAVRCRLLTPLDAGGTLHEPDAIVAVDAAGRLDWVGPASSWPGPHDGLVDVRPSVVLPGLIDLHAHLPQVPNAGLGAGLDLLTWLERYIFPLERGYDEATARARGAGRVPRLRRGRDDDDRRLWRRVRGVDGRRVQGG